MPAALWRDGTVPAVCATRCRACGNAFFPPQRYGCESCGAPGDDLLDADIPAVGSVRSFAVVHVDPTRTTPYTVGEIALDDGPLVLGVLELSGPAIGQRVRAVVDGEHLRFVEVSS